MNFHPHSKYMYKDFIEISYNNRVVEKTAVIYICVKALKRHKIFFVCFLYDFDFQCVLFYSTEYLFLVLKLI